MRSKNVVKELMVDELQRAYAKSTLLIAANYHGITSARMGALRSKLAEVKGSVHVVKNRLIKRALPNGSCADFATLLDGPTALAATRGDAVALAKALVEKVGQTGVTVRPRLYIACGISGSVQHRAGMAESSKIIAINTDANAPIFSIADYGIVGDAKDVINKMIKAYKGGA